MFISIRRETQWGHKHADFLATNCFWSFLLDNKATWFLHIQNKQTMCIYSCLPNRPQTRTHRGPSSQSLPVAPRAKCPSACSCSANIFKLLTSDLLPLLMFLPLWPFRLCRRCRNSVFFSFCCNYKSSLARLIFSLWLSWHFIHLCKNHPSWKC